MSFAASIQFFGIVPLFCPVVNIRDAPGYRPGNNGTGGQFCLIPRVQKAIQGDALLLFLYMVLCVNGLWDIAIDWLLC